MKLHRIIVHAAQSLQWAESQGANVDDLYAEFQEMLALVAQKRRTK